MFHGFLVYILFVLLARVSLVQDNQTYFQLSLLLKASTSVGDMRLGNDFLLHYLFLDPSDRVRYDHVSSMQVGCHPHQDLVYLNSSPFMKIAKALDPITLNAILPQSFPVRHLPALFHYPFNIYEHSFLTVFIIYQLILTIFQPFCFLIMSLPDASKITPRSFTFSSIWYINWSHPISVEFCVHLLLIKIEDSILPKLFNSLLIYS